MTIRGQPVVVNTLLHTASITVISELALTSTDTSHRRQATMGA